MHLANAQFGFCSAAQLYSMEIWNPLTAESRTEQALRRVRWVPLRTISYTGRQFEFCNKAGISCSHSNSSF